MFLEHGTRTHPQSVNIRLLLADVNAVSQGRLLQPTD
jgi:hypothetical protein